MTAEQGEEAAARPSVETSVPGAETDRLRAVRAIGLDTNAFNARLPHMSRLAGLVERARKHGSVEVWIPESVLWEWAEHIFSERSALATSAAALRRAGQEVAVARAQTVDEVEEELRQAIARVGAPLRVLSVAEVAQAALRDQVLLRGPARPKSGVKTGAADSAHLRAFEAEAGGDVTTYVVVSHDSDITKAYKNWGHTPPAVFKTLNDAANAVFAAVPPTDDGAARAFLQYATPVAHEGNLDLGALGGPITGLLDDHPIKGEYANVAFHAEDGLQLVGVSDVEVDSDGEYATGTLHFLGTVEGTGLIQDDAGDRAVQVWREAHGAHLWITAVLELEAGQPKSLVVDTGEGQASPAPSWDDRHTDPEEAFAEVVDALTCLPGLADFEWYPLDDGPSEITATAVLDDIELHLDTGGDPMTGDDYEWRLTATIEGRSVSIWCRAMNDGATDPDIAAAFPDHYELDTNAGGLAALNPTWAINAVAVGLNDYGPPNPH